MPRPLRTLLIPLTAALLLIPFGQPVIGASAPDTPPLAPAFRAAEALVIPVGASPGEAALEFPALRREEGKVLCARFRAFLVTPTPAGWNPYLRAKLNSTQLGERTSEGTVRLLNRGATCRTTFEGPVSWWGGNSNQALITFFGPGAGEMDSRVISAREQEYWYVLDISDSANFLVAGADDRVESAIPNKLTFTNTYCSQGSGETSPCREMRIEDITVGHVPRAALKGLMPPTDKPAPDLKGEVLSAPGYSLTVAPSGAIQVRVGKDRYSIASEFSYPGAALQFHRFTWDDSPDTDWKTSSSRDKKTGGVTVRGESRDYRVTRTVVLRGGRFHARDSFENKTSSPIGVSVQHRVESPERFGEGDVYMAGVPDIRTQNAFSVNPTVFVRQPGSSLGVVVEDNVLRLQMSATNEGRVVQFGSEHFGLDARKTYTTEWTLYPSTSRDYWDFINSVRRDWKANITVVGPFAFSEAEVIPNRRIKLYAIAPWFEYSNGSGLTDEDFRKIHEPNLRKLYAAQPDAIALGMIETNLIGVARKKIVGGEILPPSDRDTGGGVYGYECTPEQTRLFKDSPWFDCMLKTSDGRVLIDTYYPGRDFVDLMVYPAPGNYQHKFMLGQIDYLMDKVGFRGVYIDQFTLAVRGLGQKDRCDFSRWDGHTVDLDERGNITRKYTDAALVGAKARADIVRHVNSKGGVVVTNGHSVVRETTGLNCMSFQETEWTDWNPVEHLRDEPPYMPDMAAGHLDTPIGLGIRPVRFGAAGKEHFAEIIHKWVIACLKNGQLYCYYQSRIPSEGPGSGEYGALNHMFPFTPVELHPGWLVGKERIITAKSGTFRWTRKQKPVCLLFDLNGRAKPPEVQMRQNGKAWDVTIKLDDWNEVAVIEPPLP